MDEMASLPVRTVSRLMIILARLRLELGVPGEHLDLLVTVGKLALVPVLAVPEFLERATEFSLVVFIPPLLIRAGGRRRQELRRRQLGRLHLHGILSRQD